MVKLNMTEDADLNIKKTCFVMMPIADVHGYESGHFGRVYEHIIKPACIAAGYEPIRADDTVKTDYIVVGIVQKIIESDMVLCDLSARNPNVLYELGLRHAFNKPVALIKDKKTEKMFDIQGLRYCEYDEGLRVDTVSRDVKKITEAILQTQNSTEGDVNSIIQLANISAATMPAKNEMTPEGSLIYALIQSINRRLDGIEKSIPARSSRVVDESTYHMNGFPISKGDELFQSGKSQGYFAGVSPDGNLLAIRKEDGHTSLYHVDSEYIESLDTVPF